MPPRRTIALLAAVLALAPAGTAHGGVKDLWATINICDSPNYPDSVGVAARMPGNGTTQRMYMRFYVQYRDAGEWKYVETGGTSPWFRVGSARYAWAQKGYTFRFDPPAAGTKYTMRGLVKFQWRRGRKVAKKTHRVTASGHPTRDADPKGYSAAQCTLEGPPPQDGQPPYQDPNPPPAR